MIIKGLLNVCLWEACAWSLCDCVVLWPLLDDNIGRLCDFLINICFVEIRLFDALHGLIWLLSNFGWDNAPLLRRLGVRISCLLHLNFVPFRLEVCRDNGGFRSINLCIIIFLKLGFLRAGQVFYLKIFFSSCQSNVYGFLGFWNFWLVFVRRII